MVAVFVQYMVLDVTHDTNRYEILIVSIVDTRFGGA